MKLCKDCAHISPCEVQYGDDIHYMTQPLCLNTQVVEPVLGRALECQEARNLGGPCGPEGKYWQAKDTESNCFQNGNSPLILIEEAIDGHWGPRCDEFNEICACCKAWAEYDRIVARGGGIEMAVMTKEQIFDEIRKWLEAVDAATWHDEVDPATDEVNIDGPVDFRPLVDAIMRLGE